MNVKDIAIQSSVIIGIHRDLRNPIFRVHISSGSAETLAKRAGITNYHSIACSLSNISAKKLPKSVDVH